MIRAALRLSPQSLGLALRAPKRNLYAAPCNRAAIPSNISESVYREVEANKIKSQEKMQLERNAHKDFVRHESNADKERMRHESYAYKERMQERQIQSTNRVTGGCVGLIVAYLAYSAYSDHEKSRASIEESERRDRESDRLHSERRAQSEEYFAKANAATAKMSTRSVR